MPVEKLKTKLETGEFGQDVLFTRYGDSPKNAVCIAPRTLPTAPGEAPKIVHRLEMYPELVEVCQKMYDLLCFIEKEESLTLSERIVLEEARPLLARCKEVPYA